MPISWLYRPTWLGSTDLRSAGLFRITFGLATLGSIVDLAPILRAAFSDDGFWPRWTAILSDPDRFSLMDVSGPTWVTYGYWSLAIGACVCFIVGWHSRVAALATFVLWSGLVERNPGMFDASDTVIRVLFFWSIFLPVGRWYSLDAALARAKGRPLPREGSALPLRLIQLQFAWIYFATFLFKIPGSTWQDGTAVHVALGLEHLYTRPLGSLMRHVPWITSAATYLTLLVEVAFLPLVFLPIGQPWAKALALVSGFALHFGIWVTMCIGGFSWVMIAAYPLFFDPRWVDWAVAHGMSPVSRLAQRWPGSWPKDVWLRAFPSRAVGDGAGDRRPDSFPLPSPGPLLGAARGAGQAILVALLVACVWSAAPLPERARIPARLAKIVRTLELWQAWSMFAPDPQWVDTELLGDGKLLDGTAVDVLRGDEPPGPLPPSKHGFLASRWSSVTEQVSQGDPTLLTEFANFLCREWNRPDRPRGRPVLATFNLLRIDRPVPRQGFDLGPPNKVHLWQQFCFTAK
ncbi:MAG TPA: HTTM domain-containing protein [Polyangiaceae bacterium]|nr:HTTM domain-containing protein [Polyangiaceae bacterium]